MTKRVHVAVAVIMQDDLVLIAQRHDSAHQGGKWEFPGGKVESGEAVEDALVRELIEELGLVVTKQESFLITEHDYQDKSVKLEVRLALEFEGDAEGKEGQLIRWVKMSDLKDYDFPDANQIIVKSLHQRFVKEHTP